MSRSLDGGRKKKNMGRRSSNGQQLTLLMLLKSFHGMQITIELKTEDSITGTVDEVTDNFK